MENNLNDHVESIPQQTLSNDEKVIDNSVTIEERASVNSGDESNSNSKKAKNKSKKFFLWGILSAFVIFIVVGIAIFFVNKVSAEKLYEKNLKEFILESSNATIISETICDDIQSVWRGYIYDNLKYFRKSNGKFYRYSYEGAEWCSDFSEAVDRKLAWNADNLSPSLMESYKAAKQLYKEITPPLNKYKDIHVYVKNMFKSMERLHDLSINPKGNLSTYSTNYNSAFEDFNSALSDLYNESDIFAK